MINELDQSILFELSLHSPFEFHLQRATIITWNESPEYPDDDRAISFQDLGGVNEVWRFICKIKGNNIQGDSILKSEENNNSNILPEVTIENLSYIAQEMNSVVDSGMISKINEEIIENNCMFIRKLGEIIDYEEKNNKTKSNTVSTSNTDNTQDTTNDNLSYIFIIFKNIFLIANRELIEILVNDEFYTFGNDC